MTKNQAFPGKPIEDVIITNNILVHWIPDPLSHAKTLERMCLPAWSTPGLGGMDLTSWNAPPRAPQDCGGHGFLPGMPQNHGGMYLTTWCTPGLWGDGFIYSSWCGISGPEVYIYIRKNF